MKFNFTSALSPPELEKRLARYTQPHSKSNHYRKNVCLLSRKGKSFTLLQNGEMAHIRPYRLFRGQILPGSDTPGLIRGRFVLSFADKALCLLPSFIIAAGVFSLTRNLSLSGKLTMDLSAALAIFVLVGFVYTTSRFVNSENEKNLILFLENTIAGGVDPRTPDSQPESGESLTHKEVSIE